MKKLIRAIIDSWNICVEFDKLVEITYKELK